MSKLYFIGEEHSGKLDMCLSKIKLFRRRVVVYKGGFVGLSVGRSVCLQNILKNSKSRFGDYIAVVPTLIHTLVIIVKLVAIGFSTG